MTISPLQAWKKMLREKRDWRTHTARVHALPQDYRLVTEEIETFMWNSATDASMVATLEGILDLMEEGAATGRPVLEVTGEDVAGFAQNVLAEMQAKTWAGDTAVQLNARIHAKLGQGQP